MRRTTSAVGPAAPLSRAARARLTGQTLATVLAMLWRASPLLTLSTVLLSIALGALPVLVIVATSVLLDLLADPVPTDILSTTLLLAVGALALAGVLAKICERLTGAVQHLQATKATHHVQLLVAARAARVPFARFEDRAFHNRMQTAMMQSSNRLPALLAQLNAAVTTVITVLSLGGVLLAWNPLVLLVLLVASMLSMRIATSIAVRRVRMIVDRAELERERHYLGATLTDDRAAKEIRSFEMGDHFLQRMARVMQRIYDQERVLARREVLLWVSAGSCLALVQPVLLGYTALGVLQGAFGIGRFNLYAQAILQVDNHLAQLGGTLASIHENNLFARQLLDFLDETDDAAPAPAELEVAPAPPDEAPLRATPAKPTSPATASAAPPRLDVEELWFTYPRATTPVLQGLTLHVEAGEVLALVGHNGAGKTTLVKLLLGLYEPDHGSIRLDGVDVRTMTREQHRAAFTTILQDFSVYHVSAHDNVWFGDVGTPPREGDLEAAGRASGLDKVVAALPHGQQTVLGKYWDRGHELSGGQRQLVALARSLYRPAPVLVLDEPSAALDPQAERRFFEQAVGGMRGVTRTTLLISHRSTTVRRADRIVVMEGGRVVEQGSHEALLGLRGHYASLYEDDAHPLPPRSEPRP